MSKDEKKKPGSTPDLGDQRWKAFLEHLERAIQERRHLPQGPKPAPRKTKEEQMAEILSETPEEAQARRSAERKAADDAATASLGAIAKLLTAPLPAFPPKAAVEVLARCGKAITREEFERAVDEEDQRWLDEHAKVLEEAADEISAAIAAVEKEADEEGRG